MKPTNLSNINSLLNAAPSTAKNFRPMRRLFGFAIAVLAAIGLSAPLASANTIPVVNGNFETEFGSDTVPPLLTLNWVRLKSWSFENGNIGLKPISGNFSSDPDGGSNFTRFTWNDAGVEQNLQTTVSAGDTLSVTFNLGVSLGAWDLDRSRVRGNAYFKVGSTYYKMPYDLSLPATPATGVWYPFTFTTTITNSGNLSIGFQNLGVANNYYTSLNSVSDVTWTLASNDPNAPTSTNATLAALENTATPLAAGNFGYADPNSSPLAAVKITAVPTLGTLTYNGSPVANNDIIAAANIGNLSYLSPLGGFGSPYTTIGIKVQNSAIPTGLWSLPATMTVNVTHVNHAPTSTGGSVVLRKNTVKTFAAADFPFSDVDAGDTLQAIKVTSLPNPTNGTLTLSASAVTLNQVVALADITAGNLIYTPSTDYTGSDPFNFQVRDAALFSADAAMALSVTSDILVQNGSFETGFTPTGGGWARTAPVWNPQSNHNYRQFNGTQFFTAAQDGIWSENLTDAGANEGIISQDLLTTVSAGDVLSVTFYLGREKLTSGGGGVGGAITASFLVGADVYSQNFTIDTNTQVADSWVAYTFTTAPITNAGNLSVKFNRLSDRPWIDKISNVSVTPAIPGGYATWAAPYNLSGGPYDDDDGDGFDNAIEYVLGTNPTVGDNANAAGPVPAIEGGDFVVTFSRAVVSKADTTIVVDVGTDLSNWPEIYTVPDADETGGDYSFTVGAPSGGFESITLRVPRGTDLRKFARLSVLVSSGQ